MPESAAEWFSFLELYYAHKKARRGKGRKREVIQCEHDLARRLVNLGRRVKQGGTLGDYYSFKVFEPKLREINALNYEGRVLQHCLCDNYLAPLLEPRLIYDNAACRVGKGTHFAMNRLTAFLREHYRRYGPKGYFLKFDISKYFASIDHAVLKRKLDRVPWETEIRRVIDRVIDSFNADTGKGLPLGNQSSQWFSLFYLDSLDRLIKERLRIKHYTRYMDDGILVHNDKDYLKYCLSCMHRHVAGLELAFNDKTRIVPLSQGVDYLGFRFRLLPSGKVLRIPRSSARHRALRYLRRRLELVQAGELEAHSLEETCNSLVAHFSHGHCRHLLRRVQAVSSST